MGESIHVHVVHNITIYTVNSKAKRIGSFVGKSVYRRNMRCVYVLVHGCVSLMPQLTGMSWPRPLPASSLGLYKAFLKR